MGLPSAQGTTGVVGKEVPEHAYSCLSSQEAQYGHPDAGTYWEQKVDAHVKKVRFEALGSEWLSCYFHPKLKLTLVIFVDDFKLAGPKNNTKRGWALLREGLDIETEAVIDANCQRRCLPRGQAAEGFHQTAEWSNGQDHDL